MGHDEGRKATHLGDVERERPEASSSGGASDLY